MADHFAELYFCVAEGAVAISLKLPASGYVLSLLIDKDFILTKLALGTFFLQCRHICVAASGNGPGPGLGPAHTD